MTSPRCSGCPSVRVARSKSASPWAASDQSMTPVTSSPATKTWSTCRSPWMNTGVHGRSAVSASRRLRVTTSAGRTSLATSHSHSPARCDASSSRLRPGHGGSGASCSARTAAPAAAHAAEDAVDGSPRWPSAVPGSSGEREHGRLPPQDLRGRDRRHRHRLDLDVGAGLIGVDLQEHVADAQGRALAMGDDDLDLLHVGHHRGDDHRRHAHNRSATVR